MSLSLRAERGTSGDGLPALQLIQRTEKLSCSRKPLAHCGLIQAKRSRDLVRGQPRHDRQEQTQAERLRQLRHGPMDQVLFRNKVSWVLRNTVHAISRRLYGGRALTHQVGILLFLCFLAQGRKWH